MPGVSKFNHKQSDTAKLKKEEVARLQLHKLQKDQDLTNMTNDYFFYIEALEEGEKPASIATFAGEWNVELRTLQRRIKQAQNGNTKGHHGGHDMLLTDDKEKAFIASLDKYTLSGISLHYGLISPNVL